MKCLNKKHTSSREKVHCYTKNELYKHQYIT